MASDTLTEAISLIKAGKKAEAQKLLEPFIEANPQNIAAWMWEAETWPTVDGKIRVMEMCFQHNAENLQVQQALEKLKNLQTTQELKEPKQQQITQKSEPKERQPSKSDVALSSRPADKRCPKCGLWNEGQATKCDCGYDFELKTDKAPVQPSAPPRHLSQRPVRPESKLQPVANKQPLIPPPSGLKQCPYCAETIKAEAVVCRYCGRNLNPKAPTKLPAAPTPQPLPRKRKSNLVPVVICLVGVGLIGASCLFLAALGSFSGSSLSSPSSASPSSISSPSSLPLSPSLFYPTSPPSSYETDKHNVTYKVTGQAYSEAEATLQFASLTYENGNGDTEQVDPVRLPWEKSLFVDAGQFLYLSAQIKEGSSSITCEIWVDGVKWKHATSSGAYAIASCSGLVGSD